MRLKLKSFFSLIYIVIILTSCDKETKSTQLNPFYKLKVNGTLKRIDACGTSDYVAQYLKDTAIFAAFGCGGQRAGFYIKWKAGDGTYLLDNKNRAWFDEGGASYQTDSTNTGTLTITSRILELSNGGRIPIVEGAFSFEAIDTNTKQKI